jgi:hypothetical protein
MTSAYPGRDPDGTPAQRAVSFDDVLVGFVCASGATDGAKCAMAGTGATGLCVRRSNRYW